MDYNVKYHKNLISRCSEAHVWYGIWYVIESGMPQYPEMLIAHEYTNILLYFYNSMSVDPWSSFDII